MKEKILTIKKLIDIEESICVTLVNIETNNN